MRTEEVTGYVIYTDKTGKLMCEREYFECPVESIGYSEYWGSYGSDGEEVILDDVEDWCIKKMFELGKKGYLVLVSNFGDDDNDELESDEQLKEYFDGTDVDIQDLLKRLKERDFDD